MKDAEPTRAYRLGVRADARALTRERILSAMVGLYRERYFDEITLDEVARRAGTTTQTVIRHFGGKDGLIAAAGEEMSRRVSADRNAGPVGTLRVEIRKLVGHYEEWGDIVLRSLAQEAKFAPIAVLMDGGREIHVAWVERVFASFLVRRRGRSRERRLAQLVAITDVYIWKVLRRDRGLDADETARAIEEILESLDGAR